MEEKQKRPDICETDYKKDIATDMQALAILNRFAEATYRRLGHMTNGATREELKLPPTHPISICLDDVRLVEYINKVVSSCK